MSRGTCTLIGKALVDFLNADTNGLATLLPKVWLFTTWFFTTFPKEIYPTVQRRVEGVE